MYDIPLPVGPVHVTLKVGDPFIEDGVTIAPEGTIYKNPLKYSSTKSTYKEF